MITAMTNWILRHRRMVLAATGAFFVLSIGVGGGVTGSLIGGGTSSPDAESARAADALEEEFGAGAPNYLVIITPTNGRADAPNVATDATSLTDAIAEDPGVLIATSFWDTNDPTLLSNDGRSALIVASIGGDDDEQNDTVDRLADIIDDRQSPAFNAEITGYAASFNEIGHRVEDDLAKAEAIGLSVTLVVLIIIFGGLIVAGVPLAIGLLSIVGSFLVLRILTIFTDVSAFALSIVISLGLGLAIDYSLFILNRYREEHANGLDHHDAIVRSIETAGRTIIFSGITIAIALSGLLVFPTVFLRSFAFAGYGVVSVAVIGAVVFMPALMGSLGERRLTGRARHVEAASNVADNRWYRLARAVMKRPLTVTVVAVAALLAMAAPFLSVTFGLGDHRVLPSDSPSRTAQEYVDTNFNIDAASSIPVVIPTGASTVHVASLATMISTFDGVAEVQTSTGTYISGAATPASVPLDAYATGDAAWLNITTTIEPVSADGEALVADIRNLSTGTAELLVGGPAAALVDTKDVVAERLPLALAWMGIATFVLLLLSFGSVLIAAKAVAVNVLGLCATVGLLVVVFQWGYLDDLLGFTTTGTLEINSLILIFCIAFGLSMDYGVFLISHITEEHDHGATNDDAIAVGLARSGRVVSAAAVLIAIVFLAQLTSGITFIKQYGLGLALAVLIDAFLIRGTLVPAAMKLAGNANWWAPAPITRLSRRLHVHQPAPITNGPTNQPSATDQAHKIEDTNSELASTGEFKATAPPDRG